MQWLRELLSSWTDSDPFEEACNDQLLHEVRQAYTSGPAPDVVRAVPELVAAEEELRLKSGRSCC